MRLKASPEDFKVDELAHFAQDAAGPFRVYRIWKRKLTTFEAMRIIARHAHVALDQLAYIGLKDRQGVTSQLVSVEGVELRGRIPGLQYELLGRARERLASHNLEGNEFSIVVRDLGPEDVVDLKARVSAIAKHGLPNFFDDQRFGSVAAGQGFPARELVRGNPEQALKMLIATPGTRDPDSERAFKFLVSKTWGNWNDLLRKWGTRPGVSIVRHLRRKPDDFVGAWQHMPGKERAIHIFAYQSFIWNDSVTRFLQRAIPRAKQLQAKSVAGPLLFWNYGPDEALPELPETFPLIDDKTPIADPRVAAAIDQALRAEGLTRESFKIGGVTGAFFKHEERPLVLRPGRMVLSRPPGPDDKNPGRLLCALSFRLPPGGYATLVLKRLFPDAQDRPRAGKPRWEEGAPREPMRSRGGEDDEDSWDGDDEPPRPRAPRAPREGDDPRPRHDTVRGARGGFKPAGQPPRGPRGDGPPRGPRGDGPRGPRKNGPPRGGPPKNGPPRGGPPKNGPPRGGPPKNGPPRARDGAPGPRGRGNEGARGPRGR